ncbi:aspartate--tRNA ligase, mitochondrial isoform X2 [Photinus pyralis]|uniref:aspartate--tRNA ligase, mitochondrial isoform X2 n=1 Tax=Photinus pyralis TaxID=7054 RepID=UPI0012671691|nr:aspartate--tRNA ligase, mitochondrial isoform X2 [Photinus pyralis]
MSRLLPFICKRTLRPKRLIQVLTPNVCMLPNSTKFSTKSPKNIYLVDDTDNENHGPQRNSNIYTYRTYTCTELRRENVGERVTLCGWLEFQRMNKFLVIRDGYGHTQLLIKDQDVETQLLVKTLPYESVIKVTGTVLTRPEGMINKNQETGEVEVLIETFEVLNKANDNLPFNIREYQKAKEALRMKFRYIDLRFEGMQRNMRVRSDLLMAMRTYLVNECNFVDVETPTLFKATPGGAQEFIVPTRFPGQFYSLVQSPQQFKQMLMAGAIDRYFQIARCYRDEGSRSDRQPEFTQLDIEMSFTDCKGVMNLVEELLQYSWPSILKPLPRRFPQITYKEAMEKYGTDKPDLRFHFHLQNCTVACKKLATTDNFAAYYILFEEPHVHLSTSIKQKLKRLSQNYPKAKFIQSKITNWKDWFLRMSGVFGEESCDILRQLIHAKGNSVLFLAYGDWKHVVSLLGTCRLEYVEHVEAQGIKVKDDSFHPVWVTDFPLFEEGENANGLQSNHHPFTAPHPEDVGLLQTEPLKLYWVMQQFTNTIVVPIYTI